MNLNSKYFDSIRVKPEEDRTLKQDAPLCEWVGCDQEAKHPAPRGRGRDGEYFHFCIGHVRQYNKSYNYFNGMSDEDIATYQLDSLTGHRPTWSVGSNPDGKSAPNEVQDRPPGYGPEITTDDPFGLFAEKKKKPKAKPRRRTIHNMERKSLDALSLDETASGTEIKMRFKDLVKLHHPDLNGGDHSSVDKLRDVIQAHSYLKKAGLC